VDAGPHERGREVRARLLSRLHVIEEIAAGDPALDVAVSRALLLRVAAGELPETLRIARPEPMVAFGKRDALAPGYAEAVAAAGRHGFAGVLRLAGGRAAVFHEGTVALAHAVPDPAPRTGIERRFDATAALVARALCSLGVDARVGEVPGEYCPGGHSVNAGGRLKLAGIGQLLVRGASHTGGVVVAAGAGRIRQVLVPIYAALGLGWRPESTGEVAAVAGGGWEQVRDALLAEYGRERELVPARLDEQTLALARRLAADHRPANGGARPAPAAAG
jgi:lipoate-protein ligase A